MVRAIAVLGTVLGIGAVGDQAAGAILIDSFSATNGSWPIVDNSTTDGAPPIVTESGLSGVAGGARVTQAFLRSAVTPGADGVQAAVYSTPGVIDYRSSAGGGGDLQLMYTGNTTFNGLGGSLNLDLRGHVGIQIDFANLTTGTTLPSLQVTGWGEQIQRFQRTVSVTQTGPHSLLIPFNTFDSNLNDVDRIFINFFAMPAAVDFQITQISVVVPEPATAGLVGVAGLALLRRRRGR